MKITRYPAGMSGEDNTKARKKILNMNNKACSYDGVTYSSLSKLANKLGVSKPTITRAIRKGEYRGLKIERAL